MVGISRRGQKCRDVAAGLLGGLKVESSIETVSNNCSMRVGEQARHHVKVQNKTLFRIRIEISAECEPPELSYDAGSRTWDKEVEVPPRPDKGGSYDRAMLSELSCADSFVDQGIKMTLKYSVIGAKGAGSASLLLLLDSDN